MTVNPALAAISNRFTAAREERLRNRAMQHEVQTITAGAFTLERLLCDPQFGDFRQASPVQRAIVRSADGLPVDLSRCVTGTHESRMKFHFGCDALPNIRPRMMVLETGVRAGKTLIAAAGIVRSSLTCLFRRPPEGDEIPDADGLIGVRPGEVVRTPIVGPTLDHCRKAFSDVTNLMTRSPVLSAMVLKPLTNSLLFRRPDGCEVLIENVSTAAGGSNLRSTWLAGAFFDEADFHGAEDAVMNLDQQLQAVRPRMLPGAQIWVASSPWSDSSPFHTLHSKAFGFPSADVIAFHSDSRSMNPSLNKQLEADERAKDPTNAAREWDAIPLPSGSSRFFPEDCILKSVNTARPAFLPPTSAKHYAGADYGFEKNSSALAIARNEWVDSTSSPAGYKARLAYHEELIPTREESLRPRAVVRRFASKSMEYCARSIIGDNYLSGIRQTEFNDFRDTFADSHDKARVPAHEGWDPNRDAQTALFTELRRRMQDGQIDLPDDMRLLTQLRGVTSKPVPGGSVKIILPSQGTAHGDLLIAVALALVAVAISKAEAPAPRPRRVLPTNTYGDFCADDSGGDAHDRFFQGA